MKATIQSTNQVIEGKTLQDIKRQMDAMLSVDGPRGLTAITETGATIHTELYEGHDYIKDKNGRLIHQSSK